MKRRNFMTGLTSGVFGLGLAGKIALPEGRHAAAQNETSPRIKKYNVFGKTGLKVSDVSCGAISLFEPNVLRYAYECGVTYFDTAEGYLRTKSESFIGQALKDVRDKVIITTKHWQDFGSKITKASVIERMEASLKRLQTDHVDVAMVHNVDDLTALRQNQEVQGAYEQLKKEGKVRFSGFSTHNPKLTLKQALDFDFAQVVLFIYNHMESKEVEPLIRPAREKGIATVAMKVMAGLMQGNLKSLVNQETSYPQAAIRWVLGNPDIDCCIPTMSSYSHVEEYVAASGKPLDRKALNLIANYQRQADGRYCRVSCKECLSACPGRVAVNEVLRYTMYFENYGIEKEAIRYYAELAEDKKPLPCSSCSGPCEAACPYGLKVRERLIHAHEILTV